MIEAQRCTPTSGVRPVKSFLQSIPSVFTAKGKEDSPRQPRWTTSNPTAVTGSSSGIKRTGSPCVRAVTPRRPLKKMEALEIILILRGGRGSTSLQTCWNDNAPGSFVKNRENHKGGISRGLAAVIITGNLYEPRMITGVKADDWGLSI